MTKGDQLRAFGYLCPDCGRAVFKTRAPLALAGDRSEIECDCQKSAISLRFDGSSYSLDVPCGLCGKHHSARLSARQLLSEDIALACAENKQFSCFIGSEGVVEKQLSELCERADRERASGEESFTDSVIMYEVLSELKEIFARPNGVSCSCGSTRCRMEVRRFAVDLICADCGARLRIPAATDRDLDDLCCHMTLKIPTPRRG